MNILLKQDINSARRNISSKQSPFLFHILVTKFGDLCGCLGFLNAIKVIKRRENYAKYGKKW